MFKWIAYANIAKESVMYKTRTWPKLSRLLPSITLILALFVGLILAACGDPTPVPVDNSTNGQTEAACDNTGQVAGQILVMTQTDADLQAVPAQLTLTGGGDFAARTVSTESDGSYKIDNLPLGEYELEAAVPNGVDGKTIQPRKKYFTADDCYIESVSTVLLADGITPPAEPPAAQYTTVNYNNTPHYSLTSNPFFWLWLFDRPNHYGFGYPPYYTTTVYRQNNVIYVPTQPHYQPTNANYRYTNYGSNNNSATGVKTPPPVVSKGTTRVGNSGYVKPSSGSSVKGGATAKPGSGSSSNGSKGSTRPGANGGNSSGSNGADSNNSKGGSTSNGSKGGSSKGGSSSGGSKGGKRK